MTDKLANSTPQWHARQRRHRHNSFRGHTTMCQQNMWAIITSDSATEEAKKLAQRIHMLAEELEEALKTRIDPKEATNGTD